VIICFLNNQIGQEKDIVDQDNQWYKNQLGM
jgi:hypothetical protein